VKGVFDAAIKVVLQPPKQKKKKKKGAKGLLHIVIEKGMIRFDRIEDGLPATHCSQSLLCHLFPFFGPLKEAGSLV
jgi:hypothetical protein